MACLACGTSLKVGSKYCDNCGATVAVIEQGPSLLPSASPFFQLTKSMLASEAVRDGERKQVTVLFSDMKASTEYIADLGNYKFEILRRDASGGGETHQNWADVFVVQDGEATIVYGGTLENPTDAGNGETRGTRHIGGKSQRVSAGDVLVIPPGVPHQTIVEPGKLFFTLIVKVERKQAQ